MSFIARQKNGLLPLQTDEENVLMFLELPPLLFGHTFQYILHLSYYNH